VIATWRRHYNEDRPHSSLGNLTPAEYTARLASGEIVPECSATVWMRTRIASLNLVPEAFLCFLRQVTRCRASRGCSLRLGSALAARADAVKVGRRAELDAGSSVDRPHLDGGEHDAMLGPAGGTWLPALRSSMSAALRLTWRRGCCCVTGGTLISAEHERMCQSATPDLQPTLHRTHETICIFAGMHRLQSIEQLPAGQ